MNISFKALLLVACLFLGLNTQAQKVGHLDGAGFLTSMSDYKSAEKQLETYTKQLESQYKNMVEKYQREAADIERQIQEGLLTPVQIEEKRQYFAQQEKKIAEFEVDAQRKTLKKRDELLTPILTRVEDAIKSVAKANGYTYVLDTSAGGVLYAADSEDITSLVRSKLGL